MCKALALTNRLMQIDKEMKESICNYSTESSYFDKAQNDVLHIIEKGGFNAC